MGSLAMGSSLLGCRGRPTISLLVLGPRLPCLLGFPETGVAWGSSPSLLEWSRRGIPSLLVSGSSLLGNPGTWDSVSLPGTGLLCLLGSANDGVTGRSSTLVLLGLVPVCLMGFPSDGSPCRTTISLLVCLLGFSKADVPS